MKSFKSLVKGETLDEAMGGKRHLQFKGKDEIGDFWVVLQGSSNAELGDILFEADVFDLILQKMGGLNISEIIGLYKKESTAKKVAEKELAKAGK